ncbi:MAG: hemolysin III family protein [Clostridiales bacterium]|jgi:hemolysin III|nr:hemolysin III family protein [Clostridiales bacterium]
MAYFKDPVSALTHLVALIFCIPVTVFLILKAVFSATVWHVIGFSVFGAALILLYAASTFYHMLKVSERSSKLLRKIDHMMIFVLIAGSYTPICLTALRGVWGYTLLALVWPIAILGIVFKIFFINAPSWLTSGIYLFMGWIVIIAFVPLIKTLEAGGFLMLLLGGLAYTVGGIIYALKKPNLNFIKFGFHEIFHVFVMLGSFFHILLMFLFL